jgi:hypothetical protein
MQPAFLNMRTRNIISIRDLLSGTSEGIVWTAHGKHIA